MNAGFFLCSCWCYMAGMYSKILFTHSKRMTAPSQCAAGQNGARNFPILGLRASPAVTGVHRLTGKIPLNNINPAKPGTSVLRDVNWNKCKVLLVVERRRSHTLSITLCWQQTTGLAWMAPLVFVSFVSLSTLTNLVIILFHWVSCSSWDKRPKRGHGHC